MTPRPILTYPHPALTARTRKVGELTPEIRQLVDAMIAAMRLAKGVGLAAPQLGESLRIAVVEHIPGPKEDPADAVALQVLINPKIVSASRETDTMDEGCLSLPGIEVPVTRPIRVKVRAMDQSGKTIQFPASGFHARIVQHELDHLAGTLILDYAKHREELLAKYQQQQHTVERHSQL